MSNSISSSSKSQQSKNGSSKDGRGGQQSKTGPSLDLQERTLRVSNYGRKVNESLLRELFSQGGPVRKIVFKEQFSFVEFDDADSVAYCLALFDGVELFGDRLQLSPKINHQKVFDYLNTLKQYESMFVHNPSQWWGRFGDTNKPCPTHICAYSPAVYNYPQNNYDLYGMAGGGGNRMMNINNPMMNNPMINNPMMNNPMINNPMINSQMIMPTSSSSYPNFDEMNMMMMNNSTDPRMMRDFDRKQRNYNQSKRNDFFDRNNNEQFRRASNQQEKYSNKRFNQTKRSHTDSPNQSIKKRKYHQSF